MIANPLNMDGVNRLSAVLPSPPLNTTPSKWDDVRQQWVTSTFYAPGAPQGPPPGGYWSTNLILAPGEGAFINPPSAFSRTFVGEVVQGYGVNPIPRLLSISASIVPQTGRVATDLGLPVLSGDTVQRMVNGSYVTYTYSNGAWLPSEPTVSVGESSWNSKAVAMSWSRNFLVWP
jgi:hypothetical protein